MPFVTDIDPPAKEYEAVASLGLAVGARKGKGLFGKRTYEPIEVLGQFSVQLATIAWEKGEEGSTALVVDPQALLKGSVKFDLSPEGPDVEVKEELGEDDFINICQNLTRSAGEFKAEIMEFPGLITDAAQAEPLLKNDSMGAVPANLEKTADPGKIVEDLRSKLAEFERGAKQWVKIKQKLFNYRDNLAQKIDEAQEEAKVANQKALEELEKKIKSSIAAKRKETDAEIEKARQGSAKTRNTLQTELDRAKQLFEENGEDFYRDNIKTIEQRLAEHDKKLEKEIADLENGHKKYAQEQQGQIKQFEADRNKKMASFDERRKKLDNTLDSLDKAVAKRAERSDEQYKKVSSLVVPLTPEQTDKEFPVVFYAARYPGDRWVVFPPQVFGGKGLLGKLFGGSVVPFKPASKLGETMAAKLQDMVADHDLAKNIDENNLLKDEEYINQAKNGLAKLIDQGDLDKKHAELFEEF